MMKKFEDIVSKVEIVIVCFGLMLLIITVFLAAVLRFFGVDMSISTDLAQLTFAWISFIGADLAMRKDRHMGVDIITSRLPAAVQNGIRLFCYAIALVFLAICTYYGISLCITNAARKYQTLYISYSWATVSCPIGCGLMCITAIKRIVECIVRFKNKDYSAYRKEIAA
ncbi:MAG: TRAP transporter small permease [Clostridiales bacterium]|nr:TRAP transporter small permease [Clostridiales bacterium]